MQFAIVFAWISAFCVDVNKSLSLDCVEWIFGNILGFGDILKEFFVSFNSSPKARGGGWRPEECVNQYTLVIPYLQPSKDPPLLQSPYYKVDSIISS